MTNAHSIEELIAELASWEATAAELRRQLAGTNALLAEAKAELAQMEEWANEVADALPERYDGEEAQEAIILDAVRDLAAREAQRKAVLDLCDDPLPRHWRDTAVVPIADVLAALGVTGDEAPPIPAPRNPFPRA